MSVVFALIAMASAPSAEAKTTHSAEVEQRLSYIVGDWTIAGEESTYRETCEWYQNRSFVVCNSTDAGTGAMSQSILGYSLIDGRYTYHNYGNGGTSNNRVGYPNGDKGLVYTVERKTAAGHVRATTVLTPQPDGRIHFREERSINGGPWTEAANFYYIRRK